MENNKQNKIESISQGELADFIVVYDKWKNYSNVLNEADHDLPPDIRLVRGSSDPQYVDANRQILPAAAEINKFISELGKERLVAALKGAGRMDAVDTINLFTQTFDVQPKKVTSRFEKFKKLFD
ncbi:MAG: hypothetical protein KBC41_00295 [Candidatus Pacebacteria bacterium]|jgi:hypothetical protein|nr:hypothetical protein [Candidatus Paceibacterota bacterium]MBP9866506.1 hypothetical protein [Candidatus Paceibacterota bacterium]